jgi:hypothetical protein
MNNKTFKNVALRAWLTCSNFLYATVESLPTHIFALVATLPVLIFWVLLLIKKPINHLPAVLHQDWLVQFFSSQLNLAQHQTSLPASFLIFSLHTLNIGLFLYLARPHLSKLMCLWACWYIGIHPSHMSWLGRLDYIPVVFECTLVLSSMIVLKKIFEVSHNPTVRLLSACVLTALWFPVNIWLGAACITLFAVYLWPLNMSHLALLLASYLSTQLVTVLSSLSIGTTVILHNIRRMLVALFGIGWIPGSQQWLRYCFLLFWAASLIGLFMHTTKRRQAGLLLLATATYLLPQIFIQMHPAYVYTTLPAFITTLGLLYENTGEADVRSVIKSLIIPIYASFLFNVIMILIQA